MKIRCLNCVHEFDGGISMDKLGWHSCCEECGSSFDVDVPNGKIVMAFTDPVGDNENPYKYFTDDFTGEYIHTYYAFDSVEDFIEKWEYICYDCEEPSGMWYWVLDNGELVCSGACDPMDIEIFEEYWGL
jgi:hypothetical protein